MIRLEQLKKALESISNKILAYTNGREYEAYLLYTGNPTLKTYFEASLKEQLGLENLNAYPSTPVVGCHVGPDVIGIGIILK